MPRGCATDSPRPFLYEHDEPGAEEGRAQGAQPLARYKPEKHAHGHRQRPPLERTTRPIEAPVVLHREPLGAQTSRRAEKIIESPSESSSGFHGKVGRMRKRSAVCSWKMSNGK